MSKVIKTFDWHLALVSLRNVAKLTPNECATCCMLLSIASCVNRQLTDKFLYLIKEVQRFQCCVYCSHLTNKYLKAGFKLK